MNNNLWSVIFGVGASIIGIIHVIMGEATDGLIIVMLAYLILDNSRGNKS